MNLKSYWFACTLLLSSLNVYGKTSSSSFDACPTRQKQIQVMIHLSEPLRASQKKEQIVKDIRWLKKQLKEANRLFEALNLCFLGTLSTPIGHSDWVMKTRKQRTELGQNTQLNWGKIDLFIVGQLNDVDRQGEVIRGVHWRDPADRNLRRWIILSRIAKSKVLAHELGHYFSLPHSKDPWSIMNKTPRKEPHPSQRGFTKKEYIRMKKAWKAMYSSGQLKPVKQDPVNQDTVNQDPVDQNSAKKYKK